MTGAKLCVLHNKVGANLAGIGKQWRSPAGRSRARSLCSPQFPGLENGGTRPRARKQHIDLQSTYAHVNTTLEGDTERNELRRNEMVVKMSRVVQPSGEVDKVGQNLNFHSWRLRYRSYQRLVGIDMLDDSSHDVSKQVQVWVPLLGAKRA